MLDQSAGLLDDHLGNLDVTGRRLVKGRGDDLAIDRALHVGDFLGPLVDQKDDQVDFRMIGCNRVGNVLQQNRLTGPRWSNNQGTLALANR